MDGPDEAVLADADQLARQDGGGLLWSLARSGAQVRHVGETVAEFGLEQLVGDRPRAVLLAGDAPARGALRLLNRLLGASVPVTVWGGADLPRWAGPADLLLAGAVDGRHPRVTGLVEQAARRGLSRAVVAPAGSPVAQAAGRAPVSALGGDVNPRAALWPIAVPLLQAADVLDLRTFTPGLLAELADGLDATAEACRPSSDPFTNPAKALAIALGDAIPLVVGAGPLAGIVARIFADALRLFAGRPAIAVTLPDGVAVAAALLSGVSSGPAEDDLFRDRVDDPVVRRHMITVGDDADPSDGRSSHELRLDELAARAAADALHQLATANDVHSSALDPSVDPRSSSTFVRLASTSSVGLFTATYLALASGIDPSAPRAGELL